MKISDEMYNTILGDYSKIRLMHSMELEEKRKKVYNTLPVLYDYDKELGELRLKIFDCYGDDSERAKLEARCNEIVKTKDELINHEFGNDYLTLTYTCPICKDTGYKGEKIAENRCECFKKKAISLFYTKYGNTAINRKHTFDSFKLDFYSDIKDESGMSPRENASLVLRYCREYVKNLSDESFNRNMYLYGPAGVGKTFLIECIFNEALKTDLSAIYLTANDLSKICDEARFRRFDASAEEVADNEYLRSSVNDCDILFIDDFGTEPGSKFEKADFFNYINYRLTNNLATVITGNYEPGELQYIYDNRIASRLIGDYQVLPLSGEDIRIKKSQN